MLFFLLISMMTLSQWNQVYSSLSLSLVLLLICLLVCGTVEFVGWFVLTLYFFCLLSCRPSSHRNKLLKHQRLTELSRSLWSMPVSRILSADRRQRRATLTVRTLRNHAELYGIDFNLSVDRRVENTHEKANFFFSRQVYSVPPAMLSQLFTCWTACIASQFTFLLASKWQARQMKWLPHKALYRRLLYPSIQASQSNNRRVIQMLMNLEHNQVLFFRLTLQDLTITCPYHLSRPIDLTVFFFPFERRNHSTGFPYCVVYLPSSFG